MFGHLIHYQGRFYLVAEGLTIWIIAVLLSGLSYWVDSYIFLVFARMLSGFGEASLMCSVPPWIESNSPSNQGGFWLSIFYTALPVTKNQIIFT
jgi:MFS family permease